MDKVREVITDREFWRDLGTLTKLALGGLALAVGLYGAVWFFKIVHVALGG